MDLDTAKKKIDKYMLGHTGFVAKISVAERYYRNKTDILNTRDKDDEKEPLRNANNKICSGFYSLLINQKASYAFTYPPIIDVGEKTTNEKIAEVLGDAYAKNCKKLCVNASNAGIAWVHYWKDDEGNFKWAVVDSSQVIPVYNNDLEKKLLAVLRTFVKLEDNGDVYTIYEIWTDAECATYRRKSNTDTLLEYNKYTVTNFGTPTGFTNILKHEFGEIPFIPFSNNDINISDLDAVKGHIDTYDKVYSGFINDLEDIQEIIFLLSGYEGEDLNEFLSNLKKYKTVKLDGDVDSRSDLKTLTIDIPVEARKELLTTARKAIFEQGQGVDPEPSNFGNASGVALKYLYSLLELKVGLMETEFRIGFAKLARAICRHLGVECKAIEQVWTRNRITNDTELASIAQASSGIISQKTILKNHPWVDNPEKEQEELNKEKEVKINRFSQPNLDEDGLQNKGKDDE